jgi:hypothetical protein
MARTNIEIDDRLVEKAMRLTGARTKREVVDIASVGWLRKATFIAPYVGCGVRSRGKVTLTHGGPAARPARHDDRRLKHMGRLFQRSP